MVNESQRAASAEDEQGLDLGLSKIDPNQVIGVVSHFARENPHAALGCALAVGFLLGGGLTPRLLGSVAVLAGRKYVNQALRGTLEGVLRDQLGGHAGT
jgi:hypothetical protein